jgi:DNA invertase Pin-like site-specific DNA recombinase
MPTGQRVGYVRVSTTDQNTERQLDGVQLDRVFDDKVSAKDTNRPKLKEMLEYVREGDTIVVHSMDRLARNVDDLRRLVLDATKRGIRVQFIKENLTFAGEDSPMANLMLSVLGAVAQFERDLIRERQREGIAVAKKHGIYKGRKPMLDAAQVAELHERIARGEKKAAVARDLKVSRETIYQYLLDRREATPAANVIARDSTEQQRLNGLSRPHRG